MNEKRAYATSCFYDSKIYVFGGLTQRDDGTSYVNNSVEVYDISADEWTYLDNMPSIKCSSSSKETEYGTFSSCGVLVGTNFYILCGIREISAKGEMPIYNDHVLIYDLVAETWTTIDMSGEEIYERSGAGAFPSQYENGIFVLFGEKVNSSGEEILSNIFMFNITAGTITDKTEMYLSAYPEAKARFGIKYDDGSGSPFPIFYSGGKNKNNQLSKTISEIEYAVTSNFANSAIPNIYLQDPVIDHSFIYNPNDGALFVIGGISTGKSSKFTTFSGEYSTKMILDGKLDINVKLSAKNIYNQLTSTTFNAEVEAYLQPIDDTSEVILPINSKNFVLLSSNEVSFVNGVCETTLEARADDVLPNISEILSIYESEQERYQIVLKISSLDTNFVGGNFIYTPTSYTECSKDSSVQIIEREIPNLVSSGYGYSVVTPYVYQPSLEKIHCYEKDIVLPYIEQLTPIAVASSGLSDALDILDGQLDIGPSYVFDAIYEMAKDLSGSSFDAYNKNILCISDKEVQEMKYNLNDVSLSVNSLEGYGKCPIEYVNLSIGQNGSVQKWKSTISLLNKLTLATVGDVTTISDGTYIEETVTSLYSKKEGTINFGKCSIIIDLTRIVNISQISLVSTGDIQWSFEYGDDGKNFTKVEEIFGGEETSNKEILSRYIKFNFILFGQCGDEYSEYGPVSPIISGINFTYNDAKEDLVFTNSIVPSARIKEFEISQSSSLEKSNNKKTYINFGYTSSNTYEWNDYEHSEISKRYIGKTILPIRDAIILSKTLETLKSKDGYVFEALYGNWDIDATVRVYDADNMEILASTYRSFPREGKIVFNEKQEVFDLYVKITDTLAKRIGMKITNFDTNAYLNLEGMSYFYAV
jgi:hypothetical protein